MYKVTGLIELLSWEFEYPQCLWILNLWTTRLYKIHFESCLLFLFLRNKFLRTTSSTNYFLLWSVFREIDQFCMIKIFDFLDSLSVWWSTICYNADRLGNGWFSCVTGTSSSDLIHQFWLEQSKLQFKLRYPFTQGFYLPEQDKYIWQVSVLSE